MISYVMRSEDLFSVPPEVQAKYENGTATHKVVRCPLHLYYKFSMKHLYYRDIKNKIKYESLITEVIDPNDKCNRLDRDELVKKQGILRTIFKGRPLPDLSLVQKTKWRMLKDGRNECTILAVNDGGHRSRTVLEFKMGLFCTSGDTIFITEKGNPVNIGHRYWKQIVDEFPEAIEQFEDYCLTLTIQWHLNAKQRKEDFDDRNEVTPAKGQEGRNANDDNVIADAVRICTRIVEGEEDPNPVHDLFDYDIIGFKNSKMVWDEIVAKIMKMNVDEKADTALDQEDLDEFYLQGSYAGTDSGIFYAEKKRFKTLMKDTYMVLDFLHGVLKVWPKKIYPKGEHVVHALLRWYFQYTTDLKKENATFIYKDNVKIDYVVFAEMFAKHIMKKNADDLTLQSWTPRANERTKSDVFKGFLGQFGGADKTKLSVEWIMDDFYSIVTDMEHEIKFGITTYDNRSTFKQQDIVDRWMKLGDKDDFGNDIDIDDARGDHDIPRSWGRLKGGITCPKTNMKILHHKDNGEKSDHMTFEEFYAYKTKKAA